MTAISVAHDCGMIRSREDLFILDTEPIDDPNIVPEIILHRVGNVTFLDDIVISLDHDVSCFDTGILNFMTCFLTRHFSNKRNFFQFYHFALDGKTWSKLMQHYPDLIPRVLVRATIFARFQPDQKTQLITAFQNLDYVVSMVGDGANDCGV